MKKRKPFEGTFDGLQARLEGALRAARAAHHHPTTRGDASEEGWLQVLKDHLPHRYRADKAKVIDSKGASSEQIDIVIYDRQYSPLLYNDKNQHFIPAESVYAVLEVKQNLDKRNVKYAADKARSVRGLHRTSAPVKHAGGTFKPRPPHRIVAGILSYKSRWNPPFGAPFRQMLAALEKDAQLDLGCVLTHGTFEAHYDAGRTVAVTVVPGERSLVQFLIRLLRQLQDLATAPAIDYSAYLDALTPKSDD